MKKYQLMDTIDNKLSFLMTKLTYFQYRKMIRDNYPLNWYDKILGVIDIGKCPMCFELFITRKQLYRIIDFLDKKIEDIS